MTKELFETLYKGFKGLEIHGDSEKADKEITLFPLFSALLKCINDVDVNENDFNKACYYIYYNAELTTKAKEKWDSKLEQAKEKKESCFGPGALFTYIKLFNLEYYNKFIVPMVRKERMSDEIKFDLRDSFCLKDIREKGANNKYQIDGDASAFAVERQGEDSLAVKWSGGEVVFLPDRIRIKSPVLRFWAARAKCLQVAENAIQYNYKGTPYALEIVSADVQQEADCISITPTSGSCELIPFRAKTVQ